MPEAQKGTEMSGQALKALNSAVETIENLEVACQRKDDKIVELQAEIYNHCTKIAGLNSSCQRKDKLIADLWEWFGSGCNQVEFRVKEKELGQRLKAEGILK